MRDGKATHRQVTSAPDDNLARDELTALLDSWTRHLRAAHKSAGTVRAYRNAVTSAWAYLARQGMPRRIQHVTREHLEAFVLDELARHSDYTARIRYMGVRVFFQWLVEEGELAASPMARMKAPRLSERVVPVLPEAQVAAILQACAGSGFLERRDLALLRLLIDTGMRRAEVGGLTVSQIDLGGQTVLIHGKGNRERRARFGDKTAHALDRYLRARRQHRYAHLPQLWLSERGALSERSVYLVVKRRAQQAGIPERVHPHLFRHFFASAWLAKGGQEGDLMALGGWRSREVMARYGAAERERRALEAHQRFGPGDRF